MTRILLVDDADAVRVIVRAALTAEGWTVDEARTADEALRKATAERYDAMVLDFVLPDADGLTVMRQLAERRIATPVIALSAAESSEVALALLKAGVHEYLRKDRLSSLRITHSIRQAIDAQRIQLQGAPAAAPKPQAGTDPAPDRRALPAVPPGARILLVDDTHATRLAVRRILERSGWVVREAATGADALLAAREPTDVVLLDHLLPDTDGVALLPKLRAAGVDAPIVALTAHGNERVAEDFIRAGATDYLTKDDLSEHRLVLTLRNALATRPGLA